jgi:hypothetical protein
VTRMQEVYNSKRLRALIQQGIREVFNSIQLH